MLVARSISLLVVLLIWTSCSSQGVENLRREIVAVRPAIDDLEDRISGLEEQLAVAERVVASARQLAAIAAASLGDLESRVSEIESATHDLLISL